jgi:hypothetical protein
MVIHTAVAKINDIELPHQIKWTSSKRSVKAVNA